MNILSGHNNDQCTANHNDIIMPAINEISSQIDANNDSPEL